MNNKNRKLSHIVAYTILTIMALVDVLPFVWMLLCSLKTRGELLSFPPTFFPREWMFQNYPEAWTAGGLDFTRMFMNTMMIVIPGTFFTVLSSSLAAFSFARIKFWGRELIFMLFLLSMMVPDAVTLIPTFMIFRALGWLDSLKPVLVPQLFGFALQIFLMRQFFMTIPKDMEDAAVIDGCSRFRIWYRVFMPLSKPVITATTIFTFQFSYNDFLKPLVFINDSSKFTVQLGLASFRGMYTVQYDLLMAASIFTLLPVLLVYIFAQKYFVEGIVTTGIKG